METPTKSHCFYSLLIVSCIICGCGQNPHADKVSGSVTVKVSFGGAPVPGARLSLENNKTKLGGSSDLGDDGTAFIDQMTPGEYVVTILPPLPDQVFAEPGKPAPKMEDRKDIPKKFRSGSTSPLKATVVEGSNEFEFDLKSAE